MLTVQTWIQTRWMDFRDDRGASLVEYALLLVLIAIVAIGAITLVGNDVSAAFSDVANEL